MTTKRTAPKRVRIETFKNITLDQLMACTLNEMKEWQMGIAKLRKTTPQIDEFRQALDQKIENLSKVEEIVSEETTTTEIPKEEAPKAEIKVVHGASFEKKEKEPIKVLSKEEAMKGPKKETKVPKAKKEKARPEGWEKMVERLMKEGKSDEDITKAITKEYKKRGTTDNKFIEKRAKKIIYSTRWKINKANKKK